jgi:MFS transporter, DHA2 family, multidrug resistance protein
VLCGLAPSIELLIAFRVLQGFVAGPMIPLSQTLLLASYPRAQAGLAMAMWSMTTLVAPVMGPLLGGWITDNINWPWIFYINIPVGLLGIFMVTRFVHEPEDIRRANHERAAEQRKNLDWQGVLLMTTGLASLQYVLEEGSRNDWFASMPVAICTFLSIFLLTAFVIRELTAPVPAVDLSLFKDKVFLSGTIIGSIMFSVLMSITFLLPLFMQELLGFSAVQAGLALMPRALAMMVAIPLAGRLYNYVQPRIMVVLGVALVALSAYEMSRYTLDTSNHSVVAAIILQGFGFALIFVPLTTVALASIPRYRMTDATGLNSLLRQIGGSLGLAAFATLLPHFVQTARTGLVAHLVAGRPEVLQRVGGIQAGLIARGLDPGTATATTRRVLDGMITRQATLLAFERMFILAGIAFLFVIPIAFLLKAPANMRGKRVDLH